MKWYFCLNDGIGQFELAQVAVTSALHKTKLTPICIYDGTSQEKIDWLQCKGVEVVKHKVSMRDAIIQNTVLENQQFRLGAFLRIDIPLFCKDNYALYTDCDIAFLEDISDLENLTPKYLAVAPDKDPHDWDCFNNGVMILNINGMRETYYEFTSFIESIMKKRALTGDQDAYRQFYAKKFDKLPREYNWKPYWGKEKAEWLTGIAKREGPIKIVHYHGPKPIPSNRGNRKLLDTQLNEYSKEFFAEWAQLYEYYTQALPAVQDVD